MGDSNSVLPISSSVKKMFVDRCYKIGRRQIHVVDELVTKWLSEEVNDADVKVASYLKPAKSCIDQVNEVKSLFDSVQTFDGWSVSTEERIVEKLKEKGMLDEVYIDRLRRVYSLGRDKMKTVEEAIDNALDVLEEKPKQLGKTPEEWRKAHQKPVEQKEELDVTEPEQEPEQCKHRRTEILNIRKNGKTELKCLDCGLKMLGKGRDQGESER